MERKFIRRADSSGTKVERLLSPRCAIQAHVAQRRKTLLLGTLTATLLALLVAMLVAQNVSRRLRTIVGFAEQIASGNLSARIAEQSGDEIGQVAVALDRTARRLEENFAAVRAGRAELEALLNSMEDGVIAVSPDLKVRWANRATENIVRQPVRIGAPVTELVRHPDFLAVILAGVKSRQRQSAIAASLAGGSTFFITPHPPSHRRPGQRATHQSRV